MRVVSLLDTFPTFREAGESTQAFQARRRPFIAGMFHTKRCKCTRVISDNKTSCAACSK